MRGLPNLRAKLSKLGSKLRSSLRTVMKTARSIARKRSQNYPDLAFLPQDVFWLIIDNLTPCDVVRCRRVSPLWNAAFGNPRVLAYMLKHHFPWTDEAQSLHLAGASELTIQYIRRLHDKVAARYHRLQTGNPCSIKKFPMCNALNEYGVPTLARVPPWNLHTSHLTNRLDRQFPEALWSHEDGLVVFPSKRWDFITMLDLKKDQHHLVPFMMHSKTIRRIRLHLQLLVIEWADEKCLYGPGPQNRVHGHYASSFDIVRKDDGNWSIVPRNESQIVDIGYPIGENDVFFSAHNRDYYAVYLWQPNHNFNGQGTDPHELLTVWDISKNSLHRSSGDSTGSAAVNMGENEENFPSMVATFDLNHLNLRQRQNPSIQGLHITNDGESIVIDDDLGLPRVVQTTFPLQGLGPHQRVERDVILPPYRSNSNIEATFMSRQLLNVDTWYGLVAQALDENSGVSFCLHFDVLEWFEHAGREDQRGLPLKLTIQAKDSQVTSENLDFSGTGKICGGENYVIGEDRNNQLVIYRFD
ncbi:hypothetical protein N7493_007494 [Penicillium malachiteum]|uniref:F-box domain-containing protein n=1 Tax=Penicillium malachiteum TaxID=1324776 RepID=A0AAD6HHT7_9EURO|nr:hypothetical protein N7493_007494 [Penicillium malachiteum]